MSSDDGSQYVMMVGDVTRRWDGMLIIKSPSGSVLEIDSNGEWVLDGQRVFVGEATARRRLLSTSGDKVQARVKRSTRGPSSTNRQLDTSNSKEKRYESFKRRRKRRRKNGKRRGTMKEFEKAEQEIEKRRGRRARLKLNDLADLTESEMKKYYGGGAIDIDGTEDTTKPEPEDEVPVVPYTLDLSRYTAPVRDQGDECGSCWAHVQSKLLQGAARYEFGEPALEFSVQALIDCNDRAKGCDGGTFSTMRETTESGLAVLESDDPYIAKQRKQCRVKRGKTHKFWSMADIRYDYNASGGPSMRVSVLKKHLYDHGPVWAGVCLTLPEFAYYDTGIIEESCGYRHLDHAVLIVGYGIDDEGDEYWLVQNSWGTEWGEGGLARVLIDTHSNPAGLMTYIGRLTMT